VLEIGVGEGAVARLVDDDIARRNVDLWHDLEARAGAQQNVGSLEACSRTAPLLVGRHVGHIRPVALAREDDVHPCRSRGLYQTVDGRKDRP